MFHIFMYKGEMKIQPLFFKKQFLAIFIITLFIGLSFFLKLHSLTFVFEAYLFLILSITFLPYLRSKLSYPYKLQVLLIGAPLFLPIFLYSDISSSNLKFDILIFAIGASITVCILFLFHKDEIINHQSNASTLLCISTFDLFFSLFEYIYYILGEEIFYRLFLLNYFSEIIGQVFACIFISVLFSYTHYLNRWASVFFSFKNYISLFIFSILLGAIFLQTKSIMTCIVLHIMYNHSELIVLYKRYKYSKNNNKIINTESLLDDYD